MADAEENNEPVAVDGPEPRRKLQEIDTNAIVEVDPAAKKAKSAARILTFRIADSPTEVQVLSTNTMYELVDILCKEGTIGRKESVTAHMWNIRMPGGETYEAGIFSKVQNSAFDVALADLTLVPKVTTMVLTYDYGDNNEYTICCEDSSLDPFVDESLFPRRKPAPFPDGYSLYVTQEFDLDDIFPTFNEWAFGRRRTTLNLFQAGRKQNHGFVERGNGGVRHMIFLPCKAGEDLSDYLHCFDYASQFKFKTADKGYPLYSWFSVVVCPEDHPPALSKRYSSNQEKGFVELRVAPYPHTTPTINSAFPKLAALAGYRKDKKVPRGWLTYQNKVLRLCTGASVTQKTHGSARGTAFHGDHGHEPADVSGILFRMDIDVESLHHLFCVAEGLLQTLGN